MPHLTLFVEPLASHPLILKCLLLVACHLVGDFAFQSTWFAMEKGKNWEVNCYHAMTYTAPFAFLALLYPHAFTFAGILIVFGSHFWIDPCKARWSLIKYIWLDQLFHYGVLAVLLFVHWL